MSGTGEGAPSREAELLARLEGLTAQAERAAATSRRELEETLRERAAQARSGELGRDWQVVQQRADRGGPSVLEVLRGEDPSPEGQRVLDLARTRLTELAEDVPEELRAEAEQTEVLTRALLTRRPGAGPRPDGSPG